MNESPQHPGSRTGAQIICEALIREGVDVVFGIPGGAIMPLYHALWEFRDRLRHVLCRHEQGAGHAAEGYARASGRVGVCIATSGPGATNLVTPIADAFMDSTPIVAITGQVPGHLLGTDAFQEIDITGVTIPITKHSYLVTEVGDLPRVIAEAFRIASSGRPGPVLIDITKDAQQARTVPVWSEFRQPEVEPRPGDDRPVRHTARLLNRSVRPLILAGNGVIQSAAHNELRALAERAGIPVLTTLHGLGAFPQDHPLSLGMPGMHGWVHANRALQQCDVLLNVGGRFDDRVTGKVSTFAPHARVIHIDIDASELGKLVPVSVGMNSDARAALAALLPLVKARSHPEWLAQLNALRATHQPRQACHRRAEHVGLMPHDVLTALNSALLARGASRVVTDVGQHQMWTAQLVEWRTPRTHITSGGAGTMGFAIPAALGAALAAPEDTIWVVVGDGGFQMTNQEIATLQQEGIRTVKVAIINNGYLGMVRQWQELFERRRYSGTPLSGPDFALLARAYGVRGITVERIDEVQPAIDQAWDHPGVAVIDFRVEREANVFPIVPAGRPIHEQLTEPSH